MNRFVLLIDKEPMILRSLERLFRAVDVNVLGTTSVDAAMKLLEHNREKVLFVLVDAFTGDWDKEGGLNGIDLWERCEADGTRCVLMGASQPHGYEVAMKPIVVEDVIARAMVQSYDEELMEIGRRFADRRKRS